jgi:hypothetical protein
MTSTHRIITSIVVALGLATSAAPASARPYDLNAPGSNVPACGTNTLPRCDPATTPPTIVRVTAPNSGFDWGDAGIGAAGGFALSMIGLGGALAVSQHRTRHTAPLTS